MKNIETNRRLLFFMPCVTYQIKASTYKLPARFSPDARKTVFCYQRTYVCVSGNLYPLDTSSFRFTHLPKKQLPRIARHSRSNLPCKNTSCVAAAFSRLNGTICFYVTWRFSQLRNYARRSAAHFKPISLGRKLSSSVLQIPVGYTKLEAGRVPAMA